MKTIKTFKNKSLYTFTENNILKIYIDDNYDQFGIDKGYKMNLINSRKGSYKGSFINNYICKKFISNQKVNLTNIETNKILNYCKYFLLSEQEYINYFLKNTKYQYFWFLRSHRYTSRSLFPYVYTDSIVDYYSADLSGGFVPFFYKKEN